MSDQPQHMNGAQQSLDVQLDQVIFPMMNFMCRGACGSFMGVPADRILNALCRNMGRVVGMSYGQGDLGLLLRSRAGAKKAFVDAVDEVKPQPALPPQGTMTKVPG